MIIYNVTVKVEHSIQEDWLDWMRTVHIPDVMKTGRFLDSKLFRVIGDETDGVTYAIQYSCVDMKTLHQYTIHDAPALQKDHIQRYGDKAVAFRTLLETLD